MVKFVVLNPDGDCSEANIQLKGKDLEKDVATILRKRCEDPNCPKAINHSGASSSSLIVILRLHFEPIQAFTVALPKLRLESLSVLPDIFPAFLG